ncbi:MAG: sugar phosphate isomerase/epimerase [Clostridia bacterium]|nr:sugar phosphate isomerase/epimerase [Clostridia bacterium]
MKICVSTYSFGSYLEKLGIFGVIDKAAELGFDGIEFVESAWSNVPLDELRRIGEYAAEKGLARTNFCVYADFVNGCGGDIRAEIARTKANVDRASALGVTCMRHDVASQPRDRQYGIGYDDCLPGMANAIREVTTYAQQLGIVTSTENHGYFSQDANRVERLINTVAHPNFGAVIDLGNFMCADEDPWKSAAILAPYAKHVHAKDFFKKSGMEMDPGSGWFRTRSGDYLRGTIIGHGDAHIYQSVQMLKRSGYDGYLSIEFEGCEDNLLGISVGRENLIRYITQ